MSRCSVGLSGVIFKHVWYFCWCSCSVRGFQAVCHIGQLHCSSVRHHSVYCKSNRQTDREGMIAPCVIENVSSPILFVIPIDLTMYTPWTLVIFFLFPLFCTITTAQTSALMTHGLSVLLVLVPQGQTYKSATSCQLPFEVRLSWDCAASCNVQTPVIASSWSVCTILTQDGTR